MLDASSQALPECELCITVGFQRVTPWAVIVHTTACVSDGALQRGPLGVPGDVLVFAERRGNAEDKPTAGAAAAISLKCIYSEFHSRLKSLKTHLRVLNSFDRLLSVMQTDNYVYFCLPIDTYTVFRVRRADSIKDKSLPTRTLCDGSLVGNLSARYLYSLSYRRIKGSRPINKKPNRGIAYMNPSDKHLYRRPFFSAHIIKDN